ncbi:MAG: hypothetical protein ACXVH2_11070 [Methanobacterium sp.]
MSKVHTDEGDIIKGDRIIGEANKSLICASQSMIVEARRISDVKIIVKSGRHKAQRIILRDNAMCMVDKKLKFIK